MRQEFEVGARPEVEVKIESGRVEIRPGEPGTIVVQSEGPENHLTVEQRGGVVVVATDPSTRRLSRKVFVIMTVPEGTDAAISTATAKVDSQVPLGIANIKTASGDVEIAQAREMEVKTASGDVRVGTVTESLRLASASGDFRAEHCSGRANFSLASGDIRIEQAECSVTATTASGDVVVNRFTGSAFNLNSMSGSARLGIPIGTTVDLDATTLSGQVILPEAVEETTSPSERHTSVRVKMVSGDLEIRRV